jgi:hypothetical protein
MVSWDEIYECTKTCGSICYANDVTTVWSISTLTESYTRTYIENEPPPITLPNCTIPFDECLELQTSYASAMTSFDSMGLEYAGYHQEPVSPYCSACISTGCFFNGAFAMSLYYWPATSSVSRDYCTSAPAGGWASNYAPDLNHTYIPTTTGPYAVVDGVTMYEGNVYISYWEPQAYDNCQSSIPRRNSENNRIITVASDALHSIRSYPDMFAPWPIKWDIIPWSLNYDDFNEPVPWSAYSGQQQCAQLTMGVSNNCSYVVKPGEFWPHMMMPPQIRNLDPAWSTCRFEDFAVFDPPVALKPANNMFSSSQVTPTAGGEVRPIVTPPTPGQPGGGGMPVVTPGPKPHTPNADLGQDQLPPLQPPQAPSNDGPTATQGGRPDIPAVVPRPMVTIGSSVLVVDPSTGLVIRTGITVRSNDPPATVDGSTFSIGSSGVIVADGRSTTTFSIPQANPKSLVVTIGSSVLPVSLPGQVIIKPGVTLRPGERPVTIDGTTISIGGSGVVMVDSKGVSTTKTIPAVAFETPAITIGPSVVPFDASGGLIIRAGQTLRPGDPPLAISGTTYSIGVSGITVIDTEGTSTIPIPVSREYITVGSLTYTMMNGQLVIGPGITLSGPGGMVNIKGTTIMLKSGSVEIVSKSETTVVGLKSKMHDRVTSSIETAKDGTADELRETGGKKGGAAGITRYTRWSISVFLLGLVI